MLSIQRIVVSLLIPALLPVIAQVQGPMAPPHPSANSASVEQNSADGLLLRLQGLLNAAKDHDTPKLKTLIRQLEIPDYQDWFVKTFGDEDGSQASKNYGRNFADGDTYLETLFTRLASENGEFAIHKVTPGDKGGEPEQEVPPKEQWRGPTDPFTVTWKTRVVSGPPLFRGIGIFFYLDGGFRLAGVPRAPEFAPGMSTYPGLSPGAPSGQTPDASVNQSDGRPITSPVEPGVRIVSWPTCNYCPDPDYSEARKRHLEGIVILQVMVQPDGSATDIQVVKSPDPELTQMGMDSVKKWRFNPARNTDGQAVPYKFAVEVNFRRLK
jgi:TonB family protein